MNYFIYNIIECKFLLLKVYLNFIRQIVLAALNELTMAFYVYAQLL